MSHLLAQYQNLGTFNGVGYYGLVTTRDEAANAFTQTLSTILGLLTVLAGIWFMIQLIMGAFGWLTAGGDKQHLETAKKRFSNAIVGLFLVVISYALAAIVGGFFGLDLINLSQQLITVSPN